MANGHPKTVKVDKTRFDDSLKRRGLMKTHVSIEMGYGKSNLGMMVRDGRFNPQVVVMLDKLYGIKPEEYEVKEEEPKPEKKEKKSSSLDMNELYKTIYTAVFNAMKQAWKES